MKAFTTDLVVDLHHMKPDEAELLVRRKCRENPGKSIMIVHGRGQGILRERIRNWAQGNPLIKRTMLGEDSFLQGGSGVTVFFLSLFLMVALVLASSLSAAAETHGSLLKLADAKDIIYLVDVELPLTGPDLDMLRAAITSSLRPPATNYPAGCNVRLVCRFVTGNDKAGPGASTAFGDAFEFARFLKEKKFLPQPDLPFSTIALVTGHVPGHAILPVLACDELIMTENSRLGPVALKPGDATPAIRMAFEEFCKRKGTDTLLTAMLDPSTRVFEIETQEGTQWLTREKLDALNKAKHVALSLPKELVFPYGRGIFTAAELRRIGTADYLVSPGGGMAELASALGRTPNDIHRIFVADVLRCGLVNLYGPMQAALFGEIQRKILDAIENEKINCLILQIDSAGGSLDNSVRLANWLVSDIALNKVRLIAWVPEQARNDAILIPLSCHEIVVGPKAVLGGLGLGQYSDQELEAARNALARFWSGNSGKNWSLPMAAIDPNLMVWHHVHKKTKQNAFFCDLELQSQTNPDEWERKDAVKSGDFSFPFSVTGEMAVEYGLANRVAKNLDELRKAYGMTAEPLLIEPVWVDRLLQTLSHPYWAMTLLTFGFLFLYIELNTPGMGIPALISLFCFILYFWASFLGGTAGWLEILLFCFGAICVMLEVFVIPGFGFVGVMGAASMIVSFVLASQTFIVPRNPYEWKQFLTTLMILLISCFGFTVAGIMASRLLAKRFLPHELKEVDLREKLVDYAPLIGRHGETLTLLMPSGKAIIDGQLVSVVSEEGTPIPKDSAIEVVEVRGSRIAVRKR